MILKMRCISSGRKTEILCIYYYPDEKNSQNMQSRHIQKVWLSILLMFGADLFCRISPKRSHIAIYAQLSRAELVGDLLIARILHRTNCPKRNQRGMTQTRKYYSGCHVAEEDAFLICERSIYNCGVRAVD